MNLNYLAGLFDGEGSVCIVLQKRPEGKPYHTLKLRVSMAHQEVLQAARQEFGGKVYGPYTHGSQGHNYVTWEWNVAAREAYLLAKLLEPFLIVKRSQMQIAIEFYETCFMGLGYRNQWNPVTEQEMDLRETYRQVLALAKSDGLVRAERN